MKFTKKKARRSFHQVKSFILKWKFLFLLILILFLSFASWELHSLSAYRSGLTTASIAQGEGDFEKAQEKLEEVRAVTKRRHLPKDSLCNLLSR